MAKPLVPHPYVSPDEFPECPTPHVVATFIADWQRHGHIRRCSHVRVSRPHGGGFTGVPTYYVPECEKDCFIRSRQQHRYPASTTWEFHGCPPDCRMYEAAWWGRLKQGVGQAWWHLEWRITGIGTWYASLSGWTQVIIALALLALASAPWRATVLEGLKILASGK